MPPDRPELTMWSGTVCPLISASALCVGLAQGGPGWLQLARLEVAGNSGGILPSYLIEEETITQPRFSGKHGPDRVGG